MTYTAAGNKDDKESLNGSCSTHNPGHTDKQNDTKDVLNAWQEDAHQRAQIGLFSRLGIRIAGARGDGC